MRFQSPLRPARLVRRYKRFLADVVCEQTGAALTVHVANPGAMTGLAEPGMRAWIEDSGNPRRKLRFSWRLVAPAPGVLACVDTSVANKAVGEVLATGGLGGIDARGGLRAEAALPGGAGRADFLCSGADGQPHWVEVKSVTLSLGDGLAGFPDAVTARGTRHLHELAGLARSGVQASLVLVIMRSDCSAVAPAETIDPAFARTLRKAAAAGVGVQVWRAEIAPDQVRLGAPGALHLAPGLAIGPTMA